MLTKLERATQIIRLVWNRSMSEVVPDIWPERYVTEKRSKWMRPEYVPAERWPKKFSVYLAFVAKHTSVEEAGLALPCAVKKRLENTQKWKN